MFSQLKSRLPLLIALMLMLPLVLAACGGGKADTAKSFLEAMDEGDADKAKEQVCDDLHTFIDLLLSEGEDDGANFDDISCEEDGDNVTCTIKVDDEEDDITFVIDDDDKICGGELFAGALPTE